VVVYAHRGCTELGKVAKNGREELEMNMYRRDSGQQSDEGEIWERCFMGERKAWLKHLSKYVKPSKIVEFGCGSGFVLEALSVDFAGSIIVGVDNSPRELEKLLFFS